MKKSFKTPSTALRGLFCGALMGGISSIGLHAQSKPHYVEQVDLGDGTTVYIDVEGPDPDEEGTIDSSFYALLPISEAGSSFELFAEGSVPDTKLYSLYQVLVGSYPTAVIDTTSADPYATVTRTRADIPYQVEMKVDNIDADSEYKGKRLLYFEKLVTEYAPGESRVSVDGDTDYKVVEAFYFDVNQTLTAHLTDGDTTSDYSDYNKLAYLRGKDSTYPYAFGDKGEFSDMRHDFLYKEKGEEIFRIYSWRPDVDGGDGSWSAIAESKVQVWPIADGQIHAVVDGVEYESFDDMTFSEIPTLKMVLSDLYPESKTSLRVYKGSYTGANAIEGEQELHLHEEKNEIAFSTTVPQNTIKQVSPDKWEGDLEDGQYTVELRTQTPLRGANTWEIMTFVTFNLKRTITINGGLIDAEAKN